MNKREKEVVRLQLDNEDAVLKDLKRQYERALSLITAKIRMLQSDELTQSRIYQINYQKALKGEKLTVEERQTSFREMMEIALNTAVRLHRFGEK